MTQPAPSVSDSFDVLVIGAGPTGLACAIDAQREGFRVALIDKGCLCNSLFHYPSNMTFFTTPELLEIGNIPFSSPNQKPNRLEALEYYRKVAQHFRLDVRQYEHVDRVSGQAGDFTVHCTEMALRLAAAFGTSSPEVWLGMQAKYDLWQLQKRNRIRVDLLPHLQHS